MSDAAALPAQAPLVLLPACTRSRDGYTQHYIRSEYIEAVRLMGARPCVVPYALPEEVDDWLGLADGVLLTGSPSNVDACHYGQSNLDPSQPLDTRRDRWTLPLVSRALALGVPLLAICRGFQEANVALGGSLHQAVHSLPGMADHRAPGAKHSEVEYAPAHSLRLRANGVLSRLLQGSTEIQVNSLHGQGVDRLAPSAQAEAHAPDGLVEAFCVPDSPAFNLCVQWHPEWHAARDPVSLSLFDAFGSACRQRRAERSAGSVR